MSRGDVENLQAQFKTPFGLTQATQNLNGREEQIQIPILSVSPNLLQHWQKLHRVINMRRVQQKVSAKALVNFLLDEQQIR